MNDGQNHGATQDSKSAIEELQLLFDIARTLDKHVDLREALGPVLSIMEVRVGLKRGMITLLNRKTGLLKIEEASGLTPEEKERGLYRLGEGLVGRVFESGNAISVPDLSVEPYFLNRAKNRSPQDMVGMSYCCVSIKANGMTIGTLSAERRIGVIKSEEKSGGAQTIMAADRSILEKVASIIADSHKLRERIMEEQFRTGLSPDGKKGAKNNDISCFQLGKINAENSELLIKPPLQIHFFCL